MKNTILKINSKVLTVAILGTIVLGSSLLRADQSWVGGASSDWNTAANWSGGVAVPNAEVATINTASGNIATVSNIVTARPTFIRIGNGAVGTMHVMVGGVLTNTSETWIGNTSTGIGTNNISGGSVVAGNWYAVGRGGGKGALNMTGGSLAISGGNFGIGLDGGTVGVVNQSGGDIISTSDLWLGNGSSGNPSTATYNLSGGSITVNSWLVIGRQHTTGTLNISGGSMTKTGGNHMLIGVDVGASTGIINQTGGAITNTVSDTYLSAYNRGTGTWNLNGGSAVLGLLTICLGNNSDSIGTMNLNTNGTLQVTRINGNSGPATSTFNFNGGTLVAASGASPTFMGGLTRANVRDGGAIIDDGGNVITISQALLHTAIGGDNSTDGGLTKLGGGTLELSGANTYTGDTRIMAGILQLNVTGSLVGAMRITNGAILSLNYIGDYVVGSFYTNGVALGVGSYNAGNLPGFIMGSGNLVVASSISSGIWNGGGADNYWSTSANWDNNAVPIFPHAVTFTGNVRTNNTNDLSGITISTLTFDSAAGPFTLNGNDVTLSGSLGFDANPPSPITQTVNLGMTWTANQTVDTPTNGNIALNGNITTLPNVLTKTGRGTLSLGGSDYFSGYIINGGTNRITGNVSVVGDGTSRFCVANASTNFNGTLVIESNASLTISGDFIDNGVIGRDGGIGTVIQNGGTFSFAMNNQNSLFLGASGNANTRSIYNLNGGVLDMNDKTLGVGLGGVLLTGAVNQVSGVVTNLGRLDMGASSASGYGEYNLTGGKAYIGGGGITTASSLYKLNLGGGTIGAYVSWFSSLNMTLTGSNGPVTFDTAFNVINLTGILSGPGGLRVTGGGTLQLGGANTYNGDTIVDEGILQFDVPSVSAGALRITNGALLYLAHSGTNVVGSFQTNGVALGNGVYDQFNMPFIVGSGFMQVVGAVSLGVWDGGGVDNNWSTAGNWDNNAVPIFPYDLTFAGVARLTNTNDLSAITLNGIIFDASAGAFTLDGNDVTLNGTIGINGNPASVVTQTVNLNMAWAANTALDTPANGNVTLGGNISAPGLTLTKTSGVNAGTLTLGGINELGGFIVNGGTNRITGNTTVTGTGGQRFAVANASASYNGTLVIEPGATLTINGSFTDNGVIGRDGGVGTVVQNGGTFSYSMANREALYIGATGNANTRADYFMNDGVLDMNGMKLGVGLGAGVLITGAVHQASGVITNVSWLDLGSLTPNGYGQYDLTGGKIYIGSNGVTTVSGFYQMNLGGGTIGALANWNSSLNMTLTGIGGPTTFDTAGGDITLEGNLSGAGGVTLTGGGMLSLSGVSTHTGDTVVNQGTLQLNSANNTATTIKLANSTTLNLNYAGTMAVPSFYTNDVSLPAGTYNSGNLASFITGSGAIQVASGVPNTPTNITFSATGGQLTLSWPASYQGWILQSQTNSLNVGLQTNWTDVSGSAGMTSTNFAITPAAPTVFYRLRHP